MLMINSFILAFAFWPTPLSLPTDSQIHTLSVFVFLIHCDDDEVRFRNLANYFYIYFLYTSMVPIFYPEQSKSGHCLPVIVPFLPSILNAPRQNLLSCSYSKVDFFGWLFVSYLPFLTSIFPSLSIWKLMLC